MPIARRRQRRAFTVAELIGVMVIVSALSISAAPAMQWMARSRQKGLEAEVARLLREARALAIASGRPAGVQFTDDNAQVALIWISADSEPPTGAPGPTGQPTSPMVVASRFPGAGITSVTVDGDLATALWFGYAGAPELRTETGAFTSTLPEDAIIEFAGGGTVTIRRVTGLVE
jgi:type II secretory pathway pseudopilin PulG